MKVQRDVGKMEPFFSAAQARLWSAHRDRIPDAERAYGLLRHWADAKPLPASEAQFLHLAYLGGCSEALFLALLRHPAQLSIISRLATEGEGLGREGLDETLARFLLSQRWPSPACALSAFRSIQTGRILLQDIMGTLSFEAVTRELSCLADVLIARALALTYQPLRETHGLPLMLTDDGRSVPCRLAVFALGKLGGLELNYASDVDLVFFFQSDGSTDMGQSNHAFFNAWVQAATALLTARTPDGPCLKLDTNLRPRGRDGELTLSFDAAAAYYREWADLWERQAWVKGRPCAGDLEAGALFLRQMEPIVYQAYAWNGIAGQNERMRQKAIRQLGRAAHRDLKEGPGGIRDAEFAIQALQLAFGQSDRWVREGHTLLALAKLRQKGILSTQRQSALSQGYLLLRRCEHWVQVQSMRQTHALPSEEPEWRAMARFLHFPSWEDLRRAVETAREDLSNLFQQVLAELSARDAAADELSFILSPDGMRDVLAQAMLSDVERALPLLSAIYDVLRPLLDKPHRRENFVRVHYSLQREFRQSPEPLRGLAALNRVVLSFASEPDNLSALLDHPRLARLLFRLISRSEPLGEAIQRWPFLLEQLRDEFMRGIPERPSPPPADLESPDEVRRWQKQILFLVEAREIIMGEALTWAQSAHTRIADASCHWAFRQACHEVERSEGLEAGLLENGLCLLGLGRLGFLEMHPRSDLDLICVKRGDWILPQDPDRSARVESRLLGALTAAFTAVTRHGALYAVDFRLRPYGASGPPVSSFAALSDYFSGPARLWERLAYLKARCVAGHHLLGESCLQLIWQILSKRGARDEELPGLQELRSRLNDASPDVEGAVKFGSGGLLHLDMMLLILQLRAGLPVGTGGTFGLLLRLEQAGVLDRDLRSTLFLSRSFQDLLLHRCRLHFERPPARNRIRQAMTGLARCWEWPTGKAPLAGEIDLMEIWREHREAVEGAWTRLFTAQR